jgi:hypothetical protein
MKAKSSISFDSPLFVEELMELELEEEVELSVVGRLSFA